MSKNTFRGDAPPIELKTKRIRFGSSDSLPWKEEPANHQEEAMIASSFTPPTRESVLANRNESIPGLTTSQYVPEENQMRLTPGPSEPLIPSPVVEAQLQTPTLRILVADQSPQCNEFLKQFQTIEDWNLEYIGWAITGKVAIELIESYQPDLVIIDMNIPIHNGIQVARHVMMRNPQTQFAIGIRPDPMLKTQIQAQGIPHIITRTGQGQEPYSKNDLYNVILDVIQMKISQTQMATTCDTSFASAGIPVPPVSAPPTLSSAVLAPVVPKTEEAQFISTNSVSPLPQPSMETSNSFLQINDMMNRASDSINEKAREIVFTSVKGGSGKTTLTVNFATAAALYGTSKKGKGQPKVALIDMDLNYCAVDTHFTNQGPIRTIPDLIRMDAFQKDEKSFQPGAISNSLWQPDGFDNLWVLTGPQMIGESEEIKEEHIEAIMHELRRSFDYIFIDTSVDLLPPILTAFGEAKTIVFVTDSTYESVRNTRSLLTKLAGFSQDPNSETQQYLKKSRLVINKAKYNGELNVDKIKDILGTVSPSGVDSFFAGEIVFDRKSADKSQEQGLPAVASFENEPLAQDVIRLATTLGTIEKKKKSSKDQALVVRGESYDEEGEEEIAEEEAPPKKGLFSLFTRLFSRKKKKEAAAAKPTVKRSSKGPKIRRR